MAKRKAFETSDLRTPQVAHKKTWSGDVVIDTRDIPPAITEVKFGPGPTGDRFDFGPWYGAGFDQIVYACQRQIERFLDRQDAELAAETIRTYCGNGLKNLFSFLTMLRAALGCELTLESIDRALIDGYLAFLRDSGTETSSQKSNYSATKPVLKALCRRGFIREVSGGDDATFPRNPYPGVHRKIRGEEPLPKRERKAFAIAVKTAVMPLFSDDVEPTSELLAYALLIIALHTGRNTQPLLEMSTDCLRSHPKENTLFLVLYKRRGHSTSKAAIKAARTEDLGIESMPTVRPAVAALIKRVIKHAEGLQAEAPEHLKGRAWLYRMRKASRGLGGVGEVRALSGDMLARSIEILVKRYNLVDAAGQPMRINVSRLRKSFINRVYEILDGDVVATATAAGNTVGVVSTSYLRSGEDAQKNWKFMGLTLVQELLTSTVGATERTPVGRCSDPRDGDYAPKNGAACMSFFNCLRCRNYVVTGDDLHRLFSFYWRILKERSRMAPKRWRNQFSHIVRLIERDVVSVGVAQGVFKQDLVDRERERARIEPHPFWRSGTIVADLGELAGQPQ